MQTVGWPRVMLLADASPAWLAACQAKDARAHAVLAGDGQSRAEHPGRPSDAALNALWRQAAGSDATPAFTLVLPIHDEERALPSVLHALLGAWLPPTAAVTVVLATNACRDASVAIVGDFLAGLGTVVDAALPPLANPGLAPRHPSVRVGTVEFLHLDTTTPGKANALELGNAVARARGHALAMSLDTNNWIEPDALAVLWGDASRRLHEGDAALLYATPVPVFRHHRGSLYNRLQRGRDAQPARPEEGRLELPGWMLAWDTAWLDAAGGVPRTATEDFALAVLARAHGRAVGQSEARVWGYGISTLTDLLRGARRFVRGELQLLALAATDPALRAAADREILHARPFSSRFRRFWALVRRRPARLPLQLVKWLVWEAGLALGRRDYRRDPRSSSWQAIGSTK